MFMWNVSPITPPFGQADGLPELDGLLQAVEEVGLEPRPALERDAHAARGRVFARFPQPVHRPAPFVLGAGQRLQLHRGAGPPDDHRRSDVNREIGE